MADTGTNLLLAWAIQLAVLGDLWPKRVQWRVGSLSLLVNRTELRVRRRPFGLWSRPVA